MLCLQLRIAGAMAPIPGVIPDEQLRPFSAILFVWRVFTLCFVFVESFKLFPVLEESTREI